jgi:hypothetical protein
MADYIYHEGGPDLMGTAETPIIVTDNIRGGMYEVTVVDFYIDENGTGFVFFDGMEMLQQTNIFDYAVLERLFYSQFSIQ